MSASSNFARVSVALILTALLSTAALADTLRLKDGSILKGKIVSFGSGKFTIAIGDGSRRRELTFAANEVDSIVFDERTPANVAVNSDRTAEQRPAERPVQTSPPKVILASDTGRQTSGPATTPSPASTSNAKPIAWDVRVLADNTANGWTNTGWVVKKGQRIRISGEGKVSLGRNQSSTPSGLPNLEDPQKLLPNVPTGALVAVIGDDNNDFIYIGAEREFTATRDGALFLGINEGNLNDNSGHFNVKVEIIP